MILIVVGVGLGVGVLIHLMSRLLPSPHRSGSSEIVGIVFGIYGALYTVLLAFVVVTEWETSAAASDNVFDEANELGALYWVARALPAEDGAELERTTKDYAQLVIEDEWPLLVAGQSSPEATALVYRMRDQINALPTETPRQMALYSAALDDITDLAAARRERISDSAGGLPPTLWIALVLGGVLALGYTVLFDIPSLAARLLVTGPLAIMVVLALVLVGEMDHPFGGVTAIEPDAFHIFLNRLPPQR